MNNAKDIFLTILRDKHTSRAAFRTAAHNLAHILAHESLEHTSTSIHTTETPMGTAQGISYDKPIMLVPILRSGITLLPIFIEYYQDASVCVLGLKRDEVTAQAHLYYENIPPIKPNTMAIILDPMIATGGTGIDTLEILTNHGISHKNIIYASYISAPEGIDAIMSRFPNIKILTAAIDEKLNKDKFIVPGLGDFGDRYFGTE